MTQFKTWSSNHQDKHFYEVPWWLYQKCDLKSVNNVFLWVGPTTLSQRSSSHWSSTVYRTSVFWLFSNLTTNDNSARGWGVFRLPYASCKRIEIWDLKGSKLAFNKLYCDCMWKQRQTYGGFHFLRIFNVAISVSPNVCFISDLILISMFLR